MGILGTGILIALLIGFAKLGGLVLDICKMALQVVGKLIGEAMRGVDSWLHDKPE